MKVYFDVNSRKKNPVAFSMIDQLEDTIVVRKAFGWDITGYQKKILRALLLQMENTLAINECAFYKCLGFIDLDKRRRITKVVQLSPTYFSCYLGD